MTDLCIYFSYDTFRMSISRKKHYDLQTEYSRVTTFHERPTHERIHPSNTDQFRVKNYDESQEK